MKFVVPVAISVLIASGCGGGSSKSGTGGSGGGGQAGDSGVGGIGGGGGGGAGGRGTAGSAAGTSGGQGGGGQGGQGGAAGAVGGAGTTGSGGSGVGGEPGAFCSSAWCWSHPLPQGETISAIWTDRAGTVIAGGDGGALMRWKGTAWESITFEGVHDRIWSIWGSSATDVWATDTYALFRFDGSSWRSVPNPPQATAAGRAGFVSISGSGPNDVWVSGVVGLYHWTGTGWAGSAYLTNRSVSFVAAASASEVWAIADQKLYAWNGTTFAEVVWPRANPRFDGVFAIGPGDAWIDETGQLWHWDGRSFTVDTQSNTNGAGYYQVFVTTPDDVWMITEDPLRRVAGSWSLIPHDGSPYLYPLVGTGLPNGQTWLGGNHGRLWRYDTNRFVSALPALDPNTLGDLTAIWSDGKGTTLAAGAIVFLRNTGGGWVSAPHGTIAGTINAIWGRSATDAWAVGARGSVYHYDGTAWSLVQTGVSAAAAQTLDLYAVGGTETGEVWAVGRSGQVLRFDGQSWTAGISASTSDMRAIWVHNADDVWACGQNGIVQRWTRGSGWAQLTARPSIVTEYRTLWGTSESNVWIVSTTDRAFRFDGTTWRTVPPPPNLQTSREIYGLSGSPDGTFWAIGQYGMTMRWNGSALERLESHVNEDLRGVWVGPNGEAWVAGQQGVILHRR